MFYWDCTLAFADGLAIYSSFLMLSAEVTSCCLSCLAVWTFFWPIKVWKSLFFM